MFNFKYTAEFTGDMSIALTVVLALCGTFVM